MSSSLQIQAGSQFGALTVLEDKGTDVEGHRSWLCRCDCGNESYVLQNNLLSGRTRSCGCRLESKNSIEQYQELAAQLGLIWLGPLPQNVQHKTSWRCAEGHEFSKSYGALSFAVHPCPECYRLARFKSEEDYQALAISHHFTFIGPKPDSVNTRTGWQCRYGHRWMARYSSIKRGTGCPECARERKRRR